MVETVTAVVEAQVRIVMVSEKEEAANEVG